MQSKLALETLELVKSRPRGHEYSVRNMAEATGISEHWIRNIIYGKTDIHSASVAYVETFNAYLKSIQTK